MRHHPARGSRGFLRAEGCILLAVVLLYAASLSALFDDSPELAWIDRVMGSGFPGLLATFVGAFIVCLIGLSDGRIARVSPVVHCRSQDFARHFVENAVGVSTVPTSPSGPRAPPVSSPVRNRGLRS